VKPLSIRRRFAPALAAGLALSLGVEVTPVRAQEDIPPAVDPGEPTYVGSDDPVPAEPAPFDPTKPMLQSIYDADVAAGGQSFWIDRILQRPAGGNGGNSLYTKGSALYMYTHNPNVLGFAGQGTGANQGGGGFAYREAIASGVTNLYTVTISDATLVEQTGERAQYPSYWSSAHTAEGLRVAERKFITHNNVAVTILDVTNTGAAPTTRTVTAATPAAVTQSISADGTERVGSFNTRYNLTTVSTRFSGDGFTPTGTGLVRAISVNPGQTVTLKLQLGAIATEIPASGPEYERYRGYNAATAWRTQVAEYNQWWIDNVPYIDVPDENIKKMSYYRTFLNRFNYFDVDIPGNDYQFPVSVEGALGYDNAIQLTQPMHMQDLKWFRHPTASYGNWVSSGETSKCDAFIDNPGSHSWGNTYEQYIAREAWNAYKVHGGDPAVVRNLAHYAECDVKGQINKYDSNNNKLIEYNVGFLTGNDADTPTFHWAQYVGQPTRQDAPRPRSSGPEPRRRLRPTPPSVTPPRPSRWSSWPTTSVTPCSTCCGTTAPPDRRRPSSRSRRPERPARPGSATPSGSTAPSRTSTSICPTASSTDSPISPSERGSTRRRRRTGRGCSTSATTRRSTCS
jgi:hypothetical protein